MATWQPPIPSGALYSRPARDLGPALALLAWCYDAVQRDGTFEVQLKEVAGELDESYHTIVKWWARLHAGPFFASVADRGRSGFRVQFAEDWIEWRVFSARGGRTPSKFESPEMVIEAQQPEMVTEQQLSGENGAQKLFNDSSIAGELPEMVTEVPAYKVLSISGRHGEDAAHAPTPPAPKPKADRKKKPPDPNQEHPAVLLFYERTARRPNKEQAHLIAERVRDLDRWGGTLTFWLQRGWSATNIGGMVSRYERIDDRQEQTNGHHPTQAHAVVSGRAANGTADGEPARAAPERGPIRRAAVDW